MGGVNDRGVAQIVAGQVPKVTRKTRAVWSDLVRESPRDTGRLANAWQMQVRVRGLVVEGQIINRTTYLRWVVRGRGWVYPRTKRALSWVGRFGRVFAAHARPVPPNDFIGRVLRRQSTDGWVFRRKGL